MRDWWQRCDAAGCIRSRRLESCRSRLPLRHRGGYAFRFQTASYVEAECAALIGRGLDRDTAEWLVLAYGSRHGRFSSELGERLISGMPFHWAEVDYAIEEEAATSVDDILIRRIPVYFEAPDQGLEVVEPIADHLQKRLGWDDAHRAREVESYRAQVAISRRWKS